MSCKTGQNGYYFRYFSDWLNVIISRLLVLHRPYVHVPINPWCSKDVANLSGIFQKFPPFIKFLENLQPYH